MHGAARFHHVKLRLPSSLALALGVALAGCGVQRTPPQELCRLDGYSGFLEDYSRLEPSPMHDGAMYEQWTELGGYERFIVDPMQVLPRLTVDGAPITPAIADELSASLREEVVDALRAGGFSIETEPGPGVARVRGAITELQRSRRIEGKPIVIGGASAEVEITDSVTGKRLGAAVERDEVITREAGMSRDPYNDARLVFRHWAARLGLWLRQQQGDS